MSVHAAECSVNSDAKFAESLLLDPDPDKDFEKVESTSFMTIHILKTHFIHIFSELKSV